MKLQNCKIGSGLACVKEMICYVIIRNLMGVSLVFIQQQNVEISWVPIPLVKKRLRGFTKGNSDGKENQTI